jgi:hypothetical protein
MKQLAIIASLAAALSGCATYYPAPANYGTRAYAQPDANGWQVVSVTPVAPGTGAAAAASGDAGRVTYSPAPTTVVTQPVYVAPPVYAPAPVYAPYAPVYADPLWYPPISIGLGFSWSHWSGGHHGWGGRGPWRGHR